MTSAYEHVVVMLCHANSEEGRCCTQVQNSLFLSSIPSVLHSNGHTSKDFVCSMKLQLNFTFFFQTAQKKSIWHRTQISSGQTAFIQTFLICGTFNVTPGK